MHGDDLTAFAHALGFSKIRIVAYSSGAHAALVAVTYPDMVVSLAPNEPPALGILNGLPNTADMLKAWAAKFTPAREAFKVGDVQRGIPLFVDGVGGLGAYDRRAETEKKMSLDNVAPFQADAITNRPRPAFTCDIAKRSRLPRS